MSVFDELKRRNVFRVAAAYLVVAWLLIQVTDTLVPALNMPDWVATVVVFFLLIGLPPALVFAWAFELTPQGLKREAEVEPAESITHRTGRKLDYLIISALMLAIGYFTYDKLILGPQRDDALVESTLQVFERQATEAAYAQKSIAVLPFANMSADPEQEYFVDGLAEELLNLLASIPELQVAARTSSFSFKGQNTDIRIIAEKLNVEHILEGSVRKAGDTLRITAQLIEADSGFHLWSQRYDRKFEDVFAIQDEIATAVVSALKISLLGEVHKVEEINPEAYALYLQAKYFNERGSEEALEKAVEASLGALKLEPEYAPAWVALGGAYFSQASKIHRDVHDGMELARAAAERALMLDERLAEAHALLGWIRMMYDWDWQAADDSMQRGLALGPGNVHVLGGASALAAVLGRLDEAIRLDRRIIELDPLLWFSHVNLGLNLTAAGRLDEAATAFRHVLKLNPEAPSAHFLLGRTFILQNQPEMALAEMKQETDPIDRTLGIILALSALGRSAESDQELEVFKRNNGGEAAFHIAAIHAWRGESDQAFVWLDTAYEQRDSFLPELLSDPLLASLEFDPRWPAFLDKMGLLH
jgi:TolB-like protein